MAASLFPQPPQDKLGLAKDAFFIASQPHEDGQEFVLVHPRPFMGQSLNFFLDNEAPYKTGSLPRQSFIEENVYSRLSPEKETTVHSDDFEQRLHRLHRHIGRQGIGIAFIAFYEEMYSSWANAFQDGQTDSVYFPLNHAQIYGDFRAYTQWQVEQWKRQMPVQPVWWGAEAIRKLLEMIAPTDRLAEITAGYHNTRRSADEGYVKLGHALIRYLEELPGEAADDLVGNALARLPYASKGSANHTLARRLIIDLAGKRHWIEMPHVYDIKLGSTDELQFPEPSVEFSGETVTIFDENGVSVELECEEDDDPSRPMKWSICKYTLPTSNYRQGQYPAVAWKRDTNGQRTFLNQADTVEIVRSAGIPIQGSPDSYLGKLLVRHFRQEQEYKESALTKTWQTEMSLLGRNGAKRRITIRELPVWIQLPQHQQDLVNSHFIRAAETLLV